MNNNILYLCDYSPVYGGNFIPSLIALEESIKQRGDSCIYVFPTEAEQKTWFKQMQKIGKKIYTINFQQSRYKLIKQLSIFVKKHNISLIHSHFAPILPLEIFAILHKNIKVIIHLHSDFSLENRSIKIKLKRWILYKLFSFRVCFISVSKAFINYNPKKIFYIPNALATNRMPCKHYSGIEIRKKYNVKDNEFLCEIFAWSPLVKGLDIAIKAVNKMNQQKKLIKLAIIYGYTMSIKELQTWIKMHTSCNGNEDFLLYLSPTEDVFGYHEAADILLSASRSEGFPYSILEMLSLGKPCCVSDILGTAWAKEFENAFFFPSENVDACINALEKANKFQKESKDTISKIYKKYNIDKWVQDIIKYY